MKKILLFSLLACTLIACEPGLHTTTPLQLSSEQRMMVIGQNEFSLDLLRTVAQGQSNVVISPLSISIAASMVANGASGETLDQIQEVLGLDDYSIEDMNNYFQLLTTRLPQLDNRNKCWIANAIWIDDEEPVHSDYIAINKTYYNAQVENIELSDPSSAKTINRWASDHTNGLIREIVDGNYFSDELHMMLANAIYFKGKWDKDFKRSNTRTEAFTLENGQKKDVKMMHMHEEMEVHGSEDIPVRILRMYYKERQYCMDVILPDEGVTVDEALAELSAEDLNLEHMASDFGDRDVALPKFTQRTHHNLIPVMQSLGMTDVFSDTRCQLPGISDNHLYVSDMLQEAYVEVDEEGTTAAAVTLIGMKESVPMPGDPFIVDRPFVFLIREAQNGIILFAGKISNPVAE